MRTRKAVYSMDEQEARRIIMNMALKGGFTHTEYEALKAIFRELEELQQYRQLGTIEELKKR